MSTAPPTTITVTCPRCSREGWTRAVRGMLWDLCALCHGWGTIEVRKDLGR